jgi:DNA-binding GntR family transcriptional regulator
MPHITAVFQPVARADLNQQAYRALRESIVTRRLKAGEKLSVQDVADMLEVSRSPVYDALTRLATEGLVSVRSRRGHFVQPLTREMMSEGFDVRLALELYAAERTVGRIPKAKLIELRRLMKATLPKVKGSRIIDKTGYFRTNQTFHNFQIDCAQNRQMSQIYRSLNVNVFMELILHTPTIAKADPAEQHIEIVEAFEEGRLERCQQAIRGHIADGKEMALNAIEDAGGVL